MRLRSALPVVTAATLLAAILASPGQALADTTPSPSPTSTTPATPVTLTSPTAGLPWAEGAFLGNGSGSQLVLHFQAWEFRGSAVATPVAVRFYPVGAPAGTAAALTVTDLQSYGSTYSSTSNIVLPAFGAYRVEIDLQDSAGNRVTVSDAGTAEYKEEVDFSSFNATSPAPLDFDHRTYTMSGTLTVTDPGTGRTSPFAGATVQLVNGVGANGYSAQVGTATTDADGTFTADLAATGNVLPAATYTPPPGADSSTYGTGSITGPMLYATQEQTRIRFTSPDNVDVPVGGTAVVTGIVERLAGSAWEPAPGTPYSWSDPWTNGPQTNGTTDSQGDFTLRISQAGSYQLTTGVTGFLNWTPATDNVQVHIPQPTAFTGLVITEDQYGEAAIDGHLKLGNGNTYFGTNGAKIYVQYSPDGRNWRWIGYTWLGRTGLAEDEFTCFAHLGSNANGYWRVYFPGTPDWRPLFSKAVRIWRYPTAVTGGRPNATRAYKGQTLSFSGTVAQRTTSWRPLAHAKVMLLFRPHGSATWYWVTIGWTDARGRYSLRGRAYTGGTWAVLYTPTDAAHIESAGPQTYVYLR